jgi:hypothetical protein
MFKITNLYNSITYGLFCTGELNFSSYYTEKIGIRKMLCIKSDIRSFVIAG